MRAISSAAFAVLRPLLSLAGSQKYSECQSTTAQFDRMGPLPQVSYPNRSLGQRVSRGLKNTVGASLRPLSSIDWARSYRWERKSVKGSTSLLRLKIRRSGILPRIMCVSPHRIAAGCRSHA
jgi:hypothetical protein